jgi:large repetitive protein
VALAAGANHSLALKSDGTVSAWGLATPALLGNGGTAPHDCDAGAPNLPCAVTPVNVSSLTNIVAITAGAAHNLAISHPADTTSVNAQSATSNYGLASVNLTATVSNTGGATPVGEGTVTFTVRDGANAVVGSPITSATVVNGVVGVTFPLVGVPAASYTIHVTYSGSTNFLASIDLTPASLVVNKATTSVTVSAAAVNYGVASVQLSATVANTASPPAALTGGTVTFSVSGGVCSSAAIPVSTSSSSAVVNFTCTLGSTGVGTYVITATYSGDANFNGSADTDNLVINRTDTTTTIGASGVTPASVSFCGNSVTITANVTSATGVTVNEGTVNFVITGPGSLGPVNGIAVVNGVASTNLTLGTATSGSYAVTATYVPLATTPNFNGSTTGGSGNGAFGITARNTTTTVSAVTRTYGQSIPLQAQVVTNPTSGCNVNTGNVTFVIKQGATTVATVPPVAVNGGGTASATYTTPVLPAGSYTIEASYGATTNFNASLGSSALTVQKANTSTTAANLAGVYGGSVQLTATVTNTSNGVNLTGGTVTFVVAQTPTTVCTPAAVAIPTDDDSVIVNATCNFGTVAPGTYAITATYSGDANFNGSDNTLALGTLTISKADTSTGVSVASATYGTNSVTLNATVGNTPNNAALTGGTVQFIVSQGATTVCTVTSGAVVGADPRAVSASCPLNTPPRAGAGTYTIDATYSGDANFNGSVGSNTLTINKASTTTAAINATATYGDNSVTLSATVGNSSNNVDLTGGTVTFTIADVCTVVSGPVVGTDPTTVTASCPIDGPPREGGGTYNIGAAYSGDANFNSSIDASPGTLTINAAMSSTTVSNVSGPYGGSVQLSATVQSGNGVALTGGSVTLVATGVCSATVPITAGSASANVQATCSFGTVAPGVYALTATYSGNADVTGSGATPGTATITQANTAISVTDVSVAFGAGTAQLSATVQNNSGTASITGGTVDFNIPGVCNPGPVAVPATGNSVTVSTTACNPSAAALGTYAIEAVYSGDTNFAGSTATPGTLTVGTANSTTAAADVAVTYGSAEVQLSATVQSNTTAALTGGSVTFAVAGGCTSGALPIPTGSVTAVVTFDCPLGSLAAGAHTITATYSGDGNFVGGNDTATLTVNKANTTTATLGVSATYGGGSVQLSATVSNASNGANLTGGTVNFVVGPIGSPVCTPSVAVPAGGNPRTVTATCAPGIAAPGTYAIVANYVGDANFSNSTSSPAVANLTIAKANTSLQVSNASITYAGGNVQLTATVTNTSNGANLSGGTVDFNVAGVCDPGPVAVPTAGSSGQVSVSCAVGTVAPNPAYAISANYSGDTNFNSSVGSGTLTINKRTPIVSVNDVTVGVEATEVILTATLSSGDASINLSGGTFTLSVAGICDSGALAVPTDDDTASYQFTCVLNGAAPGVYTINGSFSGDANFNAASDTATLDIDQPTIPLTVSVNNSSVHVVATGIDEMVNTVTVIQIMPGEPVTATAQAQGGFTFVGWTFDGAEVGWANPVTLTVDGPHTLEANFVQTPVFPDVQPDQLFTNAVNQLAARGLIRGYQNGNFGPNDRVQRSQMAALIARAMPAGPGTPTNGTLTPPACLVAGSWDCEDWGNDFFNPGGVDPNLWRNVGALASHNVAFGYGDGTFGPFDDVTYAQTISFITRAMIEKGYWQSLPGTPHPYLNVPGAHAADVATFYFYTQAAQFGGVPDGPVAGNGGFGDWNSPSTRGWFARALWAAVNSYFGQDVAGMGGFIP